jgi:hypothetical protein
VLEFSCGARDWWGAWSSLVLFPEDVASASRLRAERVFNFSLSMGTVKNMTVRVLSRFPTGNSR